MEQQFKAILAQLQCNTGPNTASPHSERVQALMERARNKG